MDERMTFVSGLLEGEKMTKLCRECNISRKTGYKFLNRFKEEGLEGLEGLSDKSRGPLNPANGLARFVETRIVDVKKEYAS